MTKVIASDGQEINYLHQIVQSGENTSTNGNLVKVTLANQVVHTYQYGDVNDSHDLTYIQEGTDAIPFVNTFNEDGKIISQQYGNSIVDIEYIVDFQQTKLTQSIVDNDGKTIHSATNYYEFDTQGLLTKKTNSAGQIVKHLYNGRNQETAVERWITDPVSSEQTLQKRVEYGYDSRGNLTLFANYDGSQLLDKTVTTYNDNNKMETESEIAPDGETRTTTYVYNSNQTLKSVDGPRTDVNDITSYAYDEFQNLISVTNALSQTVKFENFNNDGLPLTIIDVNGVKHLFEYFPNGRIKSASSNGVATNFEWYDFNQIRKVIRASGQSVTYEYQLLTDSNPQPIATQSSLDSGNSRTGSNFGMSSISNFKRVRYVVKAVQDNLGNRIELGIDSFGNITSYQIKDTEGDVKYARTQTFDNLGALYKQLGNNGQSNEFNYDSHGNLSSITNALNNTTVSEFDSLNQLNKITDPLNATTEFSYGTDQSLQSVNDAENKKTEYEYNAFYELIKLTSPDTGTTTYTYEKAGNRLTQTDARGVTVTYTYDALNRVTSESYADVSENVSYVYDEITNGNIGVGRLTSVISQGGSSTYTYNHFGRVSKETQVIDGKTYITEYHFDASAKLTSITYPSGRVLSYTFDSLDRVSGMSSNYQNQVTTLASKMTYLPFGPLNSLENGNGKILSNTYDLDYRLTDKSVSGITTSSYAYDLTNNITSISDSLDTGNNQTLTYDKLSRLLLAKGGYGDLGFSYDNIGNRLTKSENSSADVYSYAEESHRLIKITGTNPNNFTHDAIGNTLIKGELTFTYNQKGRLKTAAKDGMNASYEYNYRGERIAKLVNGVTTHFIYDLNGQLIAEADSNGAIQKEYIYLNGQRLASVVSGALYYVHTDHLGTPIALTDEAGTVQWKAHYTPFGKTIIDVNNLSQNIRFPGQYFDQETGLHYNYFRDYDPEIGRYIQSDPIGLNGGINTYGYVGGNPLKYTDANGLCFGICTAIVTAATACAASVACVAAGAAVVGAIGYGLNPYNRPGFNPNNSTTLPNIDPNTYQYDDDGHIDENDLIDNAPLPSGPFFDPNNNNCDENRRNLKKLKERLARQDTNKLDGIARNGVIGNQQSAASHAIRIGRITKAIAKYEQAVAHCPPEECE